MTPNTQGSPATIGILLIDDHAVVRAALRCLLERQPGIMVVGEAATRAEAVLIASREQPEIILLDLCLQEESGLDLIPELLATVEDTKILVLTGVQNPAEHEQAMRLGAMGVVYKQASADMLIKAICRISAGEIWLDRRVTASLVVGLRRDLRAPGSSAVSDKGSQLTGREREIISLVGEGLKNKQIADRLCISEATVRHHLTSILKKLDVSDRLELLIFAYQHNLIPLKQDIAREKVKSPPAVSGRSVH